MLTIDPWKTKNGGQLTAIERSHKSQTQIAREVGFERPNFVTMLKQGSTRLPLERIPATAAALGVDPFELLNLAMTEYYPEKWTVVRRTLAGVDKSLWAL